MTRNTQGKKRLIQAVLACALGAAGSAALAADWIAVTAWPQSNFQARSLQAFAAEVEKATQGEVKIKVHTGGDLGLKGPELLGAVRDGIVPMADMLLSQQVGDAPLLGLESVPYLTRNLDELAVLQKHALPYYQKLAEQNNQKFLYFVPWPGQGLFTKQPAETIAQLKGVKIRTIDKNGTDFFKALGGVPIQMPWGEVVPALASGAIQGVTTSSPSGVDGKFWEFVGHFNRINWHSSSDAVSVNLDAWNDLKPEQRQAIEEVAARMQPQFWATARDEDSRNAKQLADNGIKVIEPSAQMAEELTRTAEPLWQGFAKAVGPDAQRIIEAYRQESGR